MSDKKKYEIRTSEELGRYVVAACDLRAGEVVSAEAPLVVGPTCDSELLCFNCHAPIAHKFDACRDCRVAPLCAGRTCSPQAQSWHDTAECGAFAALRQRGLSPQALVSRLAALLPLRCLVRRQTDPRAWEELMRMEHHLEARRGTDIWSFHEPTVRFLESLGLIGDDDDKDLVQRICGVIDVNSFELRAPADAAAAAAGAACAPFVLRGVYPQAQLMAHDCVGNTHLAVGADNVMVVRAACDIPAGRDILNNYVAAFQSTAERQRRLRIGKYFTCSCRRCRDPSELGTHLGSVSCPRCPGGLAAPPPPATATADDDALWRCHGCGGRFDAEEMERKVRACATKLENINKCDADELEEYIDVVSRYLAPGHCLVLEAKQCLAGVLRGHIHRAAPRAPARTLRRELQLLAELLDVLNKLYPQISRVRAITLYEMQATSALLARRLYDGRDITADVYREQLAECEALLRQAVEMLVLEPTGSPESRLCARALRELRDLRAAAAAATSPAAASVAARRH